MADDRAAAPAWKAQLTPVNLDGRRAYVYERGEGDPVIFLHGIPTQAFLWRNVVPVVAQDYRAIAPDLQGFGFSEHTDAADLSPGGQADFIQRLTMELGIARYALVAQHFGALVATELLAREPERISHLVLMNTSVWEEDWEGPPLGLSKLLRTPILAGAGMRLARPFMLKQVLAYNVNDRSRLTSDVVDVYYHPFTQGFGDVLLQLYRTPPGTPAEFSRWREALEVFPGAGLVVWGGLDRALPVYIGQRMTSILPQANLEVFAHSSQLVPEDGPRALGRLINAFLDGIYRP